MFKPMKHQLVSLKHDAKSELVFDTSDPGTGKTYVRILGFAGRRAKGGGAMLVLAPRSLLRNVWANDIRKFAPELTSSVADAANRERAFAAEADVYITNVDAAVWLARQKPAFFGRFSELVVDECFPAGTPVDTPSGPKAIETIKPGDIVNTSAGGLPVTNTFVSQSDILVRLELEDGTTFECTENHPIATSDGWRKAGDALHLQAVRLDVCQQPQPRSAVLWQKLLKACGLGQRNSLRAGGIRSENSRVNDGQTRASQGQAPYRNDQILAKPGAQEVRSQAESARRQRTSFGVRADGGGDATANLGATIRHTDKTAPWFGLSDGVQSRLRERQAQEDFGDRRELALIAKTLGCQERYIIGLSRVVRISRLECGGPYDVFNLQVDGPHDYSVKGTLVHNCDAYKHHTSARSKSLLKISKYFKQRTLMSGTPNTNSITDIWHQAMILDGGLRLGTSFYKFRDTVCQPTQVGRSAQMVKWTDKEGAEEAVFGLLADIVMRHKFEDCVDIPENHKYTLDYALTPKQMTSYLEMEAHAMLSLNKEGTHVTAINAAAVATKLLQIASGAVYLGPDNYQVVDTGRYEMVLDLIEQRQHSLCFFLWKHQRDMLIAEATKRKIRFCVFDGQASDQEREDMVKGYQAGVYQVMFAHPASAGHGLTLTRGTATIWASPTYNLGHFVQGSKRIPRMGQVNKTETIVVVAKGTLEEKVYDLMLAKDARMTTLLELFSTLNKEPVAVKKVTKKKVMAEA